MKGLQATTELLLGDEDMEALIRAIKGAMDEIVVEAGGSDPEHRKIWHVT